jgi:hypothetical protein
MQQPDFSTRPLPPTRAVLGSLLLGLAVVAVIAAAALSWRANAGQREAEALLAAVRRDIAQDAARIRGLEPAVASLRAPSATPGRVVAAFAAILPRDVRVRELDLDYRKGLEVSARLEARTPAAWDRLLAAIESAPEFAEVRPGPEVRESPLAATLQARWAGGAH